MGMAAVAAVLFGVRAFMDDDPALEAARVGAVAGIAALGVHALAKVLIPDRADPLARFAGWGALLFALYPFFLWSDASALPVWCAVFCARVLLQAKAPHPAVDPILLAAVSVWATYALEFPLVWVPGALALLLDGALRPRRLPWALLFLVPLAAGGWFIYENWALVRSLAFFALPKGTRYLLVVVLLFMGAVSLQRPRRARGIIGGLLVMFCAVIPLFDGYIGLRSAGPLWASLLVLALGLGARRIRAA